ncbi:MAG: hypothetical protein PHW10_02835 [Candidatus Peribacteraceae bacterium]|nr:hypothetical protein [Candidatus Peribacteraceae bacterium]
MHFRLVSPLRYRHTMFWAILLSALIVGMAATLARASYNITAALTDKPDVAIYLLLPEEEIGRTTLLRDNLDERDYLAETKDGPKLIRLKRGGTQWYVEFEEELH